MWKAAKMFLQNTSVKYILSVFAALTWPQSGLEPWFLVPQSCTLSSHNPPQPFKCGTHKYSVLFSQINLNAEHNPGRDYVSPTVQTQTTQIHDCAQVFIKETYLLAGDKINKYMQIKDDVHIERALSSKMTATCLWPEGSCPSDVKQIQSISALIPQWNHCYQNRSTTS